ncbi:MAG TPA: agmatinase [Bacteroidales bacterium]|jgi:agmatinase
MINYGGLSDELCHFETAKIVVLPVPYDGTSTWIKGADKGPAALLEASANMELYDIETDSEVHKIGIHTTEAITVNSSPEEMVDAVYKRVLQLYRKKKFPVVIGGEHSVSIGAIKASFEQFEDLTVLQFDAHADMRQEYEGSAYSHACVMARASEMGPIVQVGVRSMSVEEREDIQPDRIFYADRLRDNKNFMFDLLNKLSKNVYITIDLDVFDPSVMPSTGTPEPGGMRWYALIETLQRVSEHSNIVGFDVVELCPNKNHKAPDFVAAKLIYQLLTYKFITGLK